jgi:6-phosphofructokinase 1
MLRDVVLTCKWALLQIDKCFGFDTAVEESQRALLAAKVEAASAYKGIGLVKLMGRQSGFIAMQASMASGKWFPASIDSCSEALQIGSLLLCFATGYGVIARFGLTLKTQFCV